MLEDLMKEYDKLLYKYLAPLSTYSDENFISDIRFLLDECKKQLIVESLHPKVEIETRIGHSIRGMVKGKRPTHIKIKVPLNDVDVLLFGTDAYRNKVGDWFWKAVVPALDKNGKITIEFEMENQK